MHEICGGGCNSLLGGGPRLEGLFIVLRYFTLAYM